MDQFALTCEICKRHYLEVPTYDFSPEHFHQTHTAVSGAQTLPSLYWMPMSVPKTVTISTQTKPIDLSCQDRTCPECGQTFVSNKGMKQHIAKVHVEDPKTESCPECGKEFKHKYAVKFHIKQVHLKSTRVQCPYCGKEAYNKYMLVKHLKNQHLKDENLQESLHSDSVPQESSLETSSDLS